MEDATVESWEPPILVKPARVIESQSAALVVKVTSAVVASAVILVAVMVTSVAAGQMTQHRA